MKRPVLIRSLATLCALLVALALGLAPGGCGGERDGEISSGDRSTGTSGASADPAVQAPDQGARARSALAGAERLVFIGDSLAVAGTDPYPSRIEALLDRRVAVANLAQAGTTSEDWLPGAAPFEDGLRPLLADADGVLVSVGGTDLERAVAGSDALDALEQAGDAGGVTAIRAAFERIERSLGRTFAAIEQANPKAVIVFVGYPDYSASALWRERGGTLGVIALRAGLGAFAGIARRAGADVTIDMLDATAPRINSLLSDGEHLSDAGHQLYAEAIAERLGR